MNTTTYVLLGVLVVLIVLYLMRRKSRLSREDME
jgi:LPXTG-motif cell wall-anchored protein